MCCVCSFSFELLSIEAHSPSSSGKVYPYQEGSQAGEMAQGIKILTVLSEDLGSIPVPTLQLTVVALLTGDLKASSDLCEQQIGPWCIDRHGDKTTIHIK